MKTFDEVPVEKEKVMHEVSEVTMSLSTSVHEAHKEFLKHVYASFREMEVWPGSCVPANTGLHIA